ncbi:MAG TPA: DUF6229 family protein [Pseudonocardiaceae bacterium]
MPTMTPERVEDWLAFDADGPAGPLFAGGRYAEYEITMTGGTGGSGGATGCGWCTGSICDGYHISCY